MAWNYPLTFDSKEPFFACVVSPLSFTQTFFFSYSSLCPCHDYRGLLIKNRVRVSRGQSEIFKIQVYDAGATFGRQ